jgi:hypothetical protein
LDPIAHPGSPDPHVGPTERVAWVAPGQLLRHAAVLLAAANCPGSQRYRSQCYNQRKRPCAVVDTVEPPMPPEPPGTPPPPKPTPQPPLPEPGPQPRPSPPEPDPPIQPPRPVHYACTAQARSRGLDSTWY